MNEPTDPMCERARAWRASFSEDLDPDPQEAYALGMAVGNGLVIEYLVRRADAMFEAAENANIEGRYEHSQKLLLEAELLDRERRTIEQDPSAIYAP